MDGYRKQLPEQHILGVRFRISPVQTHRTSFAYRSVTMVSPRALYMRLVETAQLVGLYHWMSIDDGISTTTPKHETLILAA